MSTVEAKLAAVTEGDTVEATAVQESAKQRENVWSRWLSSLAILLLPLALIAAAADGALLGSAWEDETDGFD